MHFHSRNVRCSMDPLWSEVTITGINYIKKPKVQQFIVSRNYPKGIKHMEIKLIKKNY